MRDTGEFARLGGDVVSSSVPVVLREKGDLGRSGELDALHEANARSRPALPANASCSEPFLRIPPFPAAKVKYFRQLDAARVDDPSLVEEVRRARVGGTYWARRVNLPPRRVLVRSRAALDEARNVFAEERLVVWTSATAAPPADFDQALVITGECDPWDIISSAEAVIADPGDELLTIAAALSVDAYVLDPGTGKLERIRASAHELLSAALSQQAFENPFSGEVLTAREAVRLCGFWRRLIDSNRDLAGGLGFAFWKQSHVAPLLWGGGAPFKFFRSSAEAGGFGAVAVWRAKVGPEALTALRRRDIDLVEVEDGFLRSRGLGADCIPPLSLTVDRLGAHFDPLRASELELLLQDGDFADAELDRARDLRRLIVGAGLGKYESGTVVLERPAGARRHILVPGQVEDDRAVETGGCGLVSNLELLRRVREQAPDAYILYKAHPDVLAGHRRGAISDRECLRFADEVVRDGSIASLIDMVDEVHVNTSLAGFEALLRGKAVATYGVPFYAGWGLTHDHGPVPVRRTARRTIDELVAAALVLYPRYLDPLTGLPCPAEVVVERLIKVEASGLPALVGMRRIQGKVMRRLRSFVQ